MRDLPSCTIHRGHALEVLRTLPAASVQLCLTSPPYFGLRDYKGEPQVWGGDQSCAHVWLSNERVIDNHNGYDSDTAATRVNTAGRTARHVSGSCQKCGAWHGSLGLEPTPAMYVGHLVAIFREVRRVLRPDGVCFLNLGDSYSGGGLRGQQLFWRNGSDANTGEIDLRGQRNRNGVIGDVKPKEIIGIPWRVAFALGDDGWYLRQDLIWAKGISFCDSYSGSTMPESVTDRFTKGHEYVFLLTKSARYFMDMEAVKESGRIAAGTWAATASAARASEPGVNSRPTKAAEYDGTRNPRSVWAISPRGFDGEFCTACRTFFDGPGKRRIRVVPGDVSGKNSRCSEVGHWSGSFGDGPSPEDVIENPTSTRRICPCGRSDAWLSHFATWPEDLVLPMIRAGSPEAGSCATCGTPWQQQRRYTADGRAVTVLARQRRATDEQGVPLVGDQMRDSSEYARPSSGKASDDGIRWAANLATPRPRTASGVVADCSCGAPTTQVIVLDPFAGSGTTALVALRTGRSFVGVELNRDYCDLAAERIRQDGPLFNTVTVIDHEDAAGAAREATACEA